MNRFFLAILLSTACAAHAQENQPQPTPEELAFARLPQDLVATGNPNPPHERLRGTVQNVLAPGYAAVQSASAGSTSFPPLSPLVPAIEFRVR